MPGPARTRDFPPSWASLEGLPFPLGAAWIAEEDAWNFAVYSEHAERVTLLLYGEEDPASPILARCLDHLRNKSGPVWHCRIRRAEMQGARFYAYQVDGPRAPYPGWSRKRRRAESSTTRNARAAMERDWKGTPGRRWSECRGTGCKEARHC